MYSDKSSWRWWKVNGESNYGDVSETEQREKTDEGKDYNRVEYGSLGYA